MYRYRYKAAGKLDVDKLIACVQKRPPVWDKRHGDQRSIVEMCWAEISDEMNYDENQLRRKWKYLRDQFCVEYGKHEQGLVDPCAPGYRRWRYFRRLRFLQGVVKPRLIKPPNALALAALAAAQSTSGGSGGGGGGSEQQQDDSNTTTELVETDEQKVFVDFKDGVCVKQANYFDSDSSRSGDDAGSSDENPHDGEEEEEETAAHASQSSQGREKSLKRKHEADGAPSPRRFSHAADKRPLRPSTANGSLLQPRDEEEDYDMLFFRSLKPYIKRIPDHKKMSFRSRILEVVEEYSYPSNSTTDSSSLEPAK